MGGKASGRNILSSENYGLRGAVAGCLGSDHGKERLLPGAGSTAVASEIVLRGCHAPSLRVRHRFAVFP